MKLFICFTILIKAGPAAFAQHPISFNMNGFEIVCKTDLKHQNVMLMPTSVWEQAVGRTQYSVKNLGLFQKRKLHIEIADKTTGLCNRGIGLGCTMIECNGRGCDKWLVNSKMRLCCVTIQRLRTTVRLVCNSSIDWTSLQIGPE